MEPIEFHYGSFRVTLRLFGDGEYQVCTYRTINGSGEGVPNFRHFVEFNAARRHFLDEVSKLLAPQSSYARDVRDAAYNPDFTG